jgi:hypothetical protein
MHVITGETPRYISPVKLHLLLIYMIHYIGKKVDFKPGFSEFILSFSIKAEIGQFS